MPTPKTEVISQLNVLLRMTATESGTARARVTQARTDATRNELLENARSCDRRADLIRAAVTELGGVPDVVGVVLARATTAARLALEQALPTTEALLADLALEHQLLDRARLVKVLAYDAAAPELVPLAEQLEDAHGDTIAWLRTALTETATGGPAALAPTGLQAAAGAARHAATVGVSVAATGLNIAVAVTERLQERTPGVVTVPVQRLAQLASNVRKVVRVQL